MKALRGACVLGAASPSRHAAQRSVHTEKESCTRWSDARAHTHIYTNIFTWTHDACGRFVVVVVVVVVVTTDKYLSTAREYLLLVLLSVLSQITICY